MNLSTAGLRLAPGAAIDLHLHTTFSDGRWTPEPLFEHLLSEQFSLAAITDHDRTDTVAGLQQLALEKHLPVLIGAELTTSWKDEMVDLLCYGFDPDDSALSALARDLLRRQQENSRAAFEHIQRQGFTLPPATLADILAKPSAEQPHCFVPLMEAQGYSLADQAVREALMGSGLGFAMNAPAAVVAAAHHGGGVCLLAHPGHGDGFVDFDEALLDEFRQEAPVDGLEVYHPVNTPAKTEIYKEYARRHHLLVSAGSDSHKPEKPPIKYPAELCRELLERVGIRVE